MLKIKDKTLLLSLNFGGKGGKEREITQIFPSLLRKDSKKLDFICQEETVIYEMKKQQNLQWFNLSKFYNLKGPEQKINFLFICIDKGGLIDLIFCIEKGVFLNILIEDRSNDDSGWNLTSIDLAHQLANVSSKVQCKAPVRMRSFFKKNKEEVKVIWEKE